MRSAPPTEQTVTDGTRHLGRVVHSGLAFKAFDAADHFICMTPTSAEARQAIIRADRDQSAALARLEDGGAPAV